MALYQTSVLKNYLKQQDKDAVEKAYKNFTKYFHNPQIQENIRSSKEEEYQGIFLTELFSNILGYTMKPNANFDLVAEFKNEKNSKKADGAILVNGQAIGVIELKGTNTKDLEKVRQQAFDYKANQSECVYVITSNFEKIRFYINNAIDFEEFDLFHLSAERFELLHLCLAQQNLINHLPLKIKEASVQEEEKITKKFYAAYSLFKRELFRDLVKLNMKNEVFRTELNKEDTDRATKNIKQTLFKKSQKLIDRFLFIFFAEDRGLLPANSTKQILDKWKSDVDFGDERPIYGLFKQYFNFLDTGRKGTQSRAEIFAYNGGLFKPDAILDSLQISNDLLVNHTNVLQAYDFESQVDVNILGHIFENSLNEIESVNAEIEGVDFDKQKTKRKKDGVFYTPKYITKYIVDNTVGKLCAEKKTELKVIEEEYLKSRKGRTKEKLKDLTKRLDLYRTWLLNISICDPACGSGAFLNEALDFLIKEHTYIDELQTNLLGGGFLFPNIENTILENNIFGVDLNEESVEIAKLSLWLRTAQPRRKLNDLNSNIKCGNSLIDSKAVAGDKAFSWAKEFPQVFKEKDKVAFHLVTATHDSRTSQRMIDYKVRELRDGGTRPNAEGIWLQPEEEVLIAKTVTEIVEEDQLNVMGFNVCGDHIHLLLVCERDEVSKIMGEIKGRTARAVNSRIKGINPLVQKGEEKAVSLWTQKFGTTEITSEEQLLNTVNYIKTNRAKHDLPENKQLNKIARGLFADYEKAFRPEQTGGFDVVIGNPPYGAGFNDDEKDFITKHYKSYQYKFESYLYFYEKGLEILANNGFLSFITPELFLRLEKSENIRRYLFDNSELKELKLCGENVFADVKVNSVILTLTKTSLRNEYFTIIPENELNWSYNFKTWGKDPLLKIEYEISPIIKDIIKKIETKSVTIGDLGDAIQGLTPYDSYRGHSKELIKARGFHFLEKVDETCGKWLDGKHVSRYSLVEGNEWLRYGDWLAAKREKKFFEGPRLLFREVPGQNKRIQATYTKTIYYHGHSITPFVLGDEQTEDKLFEILGVTNSKLLSWIARYKSSNFSKNTFPKLNPKDIKNFPIPKNGLNFGKLGHYVQNIIKNQEKLNTEEYKFQTYLQSQFPIEKLPKKLQNWHELEFGEFINELNKAIKKENKQRLHQGDSSPCIKELTKLQEMEWMEVFETKKAEAQALKAEIDKTDKEIDQMVYELYGLTNDEIAIVESST